MFLKIINSSSRKCLVLEAAFHGTLSLKSDLHPALYSTLSCYSLPLFLKQHSYDQRKEYSTKETLDQYGVTFNRPPKIPSWRPFKAGDLVPHEHPDPSRPIVKFAKIADKVKQADEKVQKVLSLAFHPPGESLKLATHDIIKKIQRHKYDTSSLEVKIATLTVKIRFLQETMTILKKDVRERIYLKEAIEKRYYMLDMLRHQDYKRFEWLINELNILYRPIPEQFETITRKGSIRKLVSMKCEEIKNEKLATYRKKLEAQQKPFLEEKKNILRWIAETEIKLGVPVSVEIPPESEEEMELETNAQTSPTHKPVNMESEDIQNLEAKHREDEEKKPLR